MSDAEKIVKEQLKDLDIETLKADEQKKKEIINNKRMMISNLFNTDLGLKVLQILGDDCGYEYPTIDRCKDNTGRVDSAKLAYETGRRYTIELIVSCINSFKKGNK